MLKKRFSSNSSSFSHSCAERQCFQAVKVRAVGDAWVYGCLLASAFLQHKKSVEFPLATDQLPLICGLD